MSKKKEGRKPGKPAVKARAAKAETTIEPNPRGRPSDYREEYCQQFFEYFSVQPYGKAFEESSARASDFPSLAGFAIKIGVHRDTLHEWANATFPHKEGETPKLKHPEFSDAYKRSRDFQENWLLVNGLKDLIPSNFAMFTSKNVIGYRDKQPDEVDKVIVNNNPPAEKLSDEVLDAKIEALIKKQEAKK